ncbi:MAG: hypothetical protein Kow00124_00270 [Anaerolineae bacterium]
MQNTESKGNSAGGLWIIQAISGLLLILVLGLHMIAHHFVVEGGLRNYEQVIAYVSNPLIFAIELVFLTVVTIHAALGARAILFDLALSERAKRTVNLVITVLALAALAYGIGLAIALQGMA